MNIFFVFLREHLRQHFFSFFFAGNVSTSTSYFLPFLPRQRQYPARPSRGGGGHLHHGRQAADAITDSPHQAQPRGDPISGGGRGGPQCEGEHLGRRGRTSILRWVIGILSKPTFALRETGVSRHNDIYNVWRQGRTSMLRSVFFLPHKSNLYFNHLFHSLTFFT